MKIFILILVFNLNLHKVCESRSANVKCDRPPTPSGDFTRSAPSNEMMGGSEGSFGGKEDDLEDDDKKLVVLKLGEEPVWVKWKQLKEMAAKGQNYLDVTYGGFADDTLYRHGMSGNYPVPVDIRFQDQVATMIGSISVEKMKTFLTYVASTFTCRRGDDGSWDDSKNASAWIHQRARDILKKYEGPCADASQYQHHWLFGKVLRPMKSVIARLMGADPELRKDVVVLGAHMDAYPMSHCPLPAADDDGSGVTVLMETLSILVNKTFVPKRTIEFHFYSYEEHGLRGSKQIAEHYKNNSVNVVGMLNLDMAGYAPKDNPDALTVAISEHDTNPQINEFLRLLINQYLSIPTKVNEVCVGCNSDHFAWTYHGYPSAFPHEMILSHLLHTSNDTVETVDFEYLKEFTKLAIAYAVEYGEPMN